VKACHVAKEPMFSDHAPLVVDYALEGAATGTKKKGTR
jgi:hypothetical protein